MIRRACAFLAAVVVTAAGFIVDARPAAANGSLAFRFDGGGWGHGTGMSQYGARGQADAGRSAAQILTHYYRNTTVGPMGMRPNIRVGIKQAVTRLTIRSAGSVAGGDGHLEFRFPGGAARVNVGETWQILANGSGWRLLRNGADAVPAFSGSLTLHYLDYGSLLKVDDTGHRYRWGALHLAHRADATFDAVVDIPSYEQYLYGLAEVPSSWPVEALRAQAIAGRSYALEKAVALGDLRPNCSCTVFSTVFDQAYSGYEKESGEAGDRWVRAVNDTAGTGVLHNGQPIKALYSSSSGGHTENNSFTFGGAQLPYLVGVADPWDATPSNPNHKWSMRMLASDVTNRLNARGLGVGDVLNIVTLDPYGVSGRVGRVIDANRGGVVIRGTAGTRRMDASQLRTALGLKDTLFRVARLNVVIPPHPNGTMMKTASSPAVWLVENGVRRWVPSDSALFSRIRWADVVTVSDAAMGAIPEAGAGFRDGSLVRTPDGRVFLISDGLRRHIAGPSVFDGLGLDWAAVRDISWHQLSGNLEGDRVTSPETLPDGLFVRTASSPALYRVVDGSLRHIPTGAVLASHHVAWPEFAVVEDARMAALSKGPALGFRDGTLLRAGDGRIFIVSSGQKRHIASPSVLTTLGYANTAKVAASAGELGLHVDGPQVATPVHPEGALVAAAGRAAFWVVENGRRLPFTSSATFDSRASISEVGVATDAALAPVPVLSTGWRDGTLLRSPNGAVFLISNGLRRHIVSGAVFDALGFSFSNVRNVSDSDIALHPRGVPITADGIYDGMFVRVSGEPTLYRVAGGSARPLPTPELFASWRVPDVEVVTVTRAELATLGPASTFRDGSLLGGPDGRIWVVSDGMRRWITAPDVFSVMGYNAANVVRVNDAVLALHREGPPVE